MTSSERARTPTSLASWMRAIDRAVDASAPIVAARMADVVLRQLPRHLPTYARMLDLSWRTQSWAAGDEWARRILQADPANPYAWRALARAVEMEDRRGEANVIWRRAFEISPYDEEIRAGVSRTSLDATHALAYNLACLAAIQLSARQWSLAEDSYRTLVKADRRRVDFQVGLCVALRQVGDTRDATALARHLAQRHPNLLIAWQTLAEIGDADDRALAQNPLAIMDPDGEYVSAMWGVGSPRQLGSVLATDDELGLLNYRLPVRREQLSADADDGPELTNNQNLELDSQWSE